MSEEQWKHLLQVLGSFVRFQLLKWQLGWTIPHVGAADPISAAVEVSSASLVSMGELRVLAMLRMWFGYHGRRPEETTDNNCEGQWCFFVPDLIMCLCFVVLFVVFVIL